jgi:galactokinase
LGEHIDYNDGFVLPTGIDKYIYVNVSKRLDSKLVVYSVDTNEERIVNDINKPDSLSHYHWSIHIVGVINELIKRGHSFRSGLDLSFGGDIPIGAGLSSSAAIESGIVYAVNEAFQLGIDKLSMAKIAQDTEQYQIGLQCGIMDMFASIHSVKDHLIKLDCRNLSYELLPFNTRDYDLIFINTNVKHVLSDSGYNVRVKESKTAFDTLKEKFRHIEGFRDVTMEMLDAIKNDVPAKVFNRADYIVNEINRVYQVKSLMQEGGMVGITKLINATHEGLSNLYEVSCAELDFLAENAQKMDNRIGSRMHGGGFGGCTLNLIPNDISSKVVDELVVAYRKQFDKEPTVIKFGLSDGVKSI